MAVAILVLQSLAIERGAAGGTAEEESTGPAVAGGPDQIADPLEAEHRVVDEHRDHRHAVRRVGRSGGDETCHAPRLGDPLLENLPVLRFAIIEELIGVDRLVELPSMGVDPALLEERIHAERARLVGDDRDDVLPHRLVLEQRRHERHHPGRGRDLTACALLNEWDVFGELGNLEPRGIERTGRHVAPERLAPFPQILHLRRILGGPVERRLGDLVVGDRDPETGAEGPQFVLVELLLLVGDVAPLANLAQAVALDCLGEDHRRLASAGHGRRVGRIDLLRIVPATAELLQLLVGEIRHHLGELRIGPEEVLADVAARHDDIFLILPVDHFVHPLDKQTFIVFVEERIPIIAPDDLDDVPACAAEEPLELLDDLAVAADGPVEPLEVAIDDEHEIVELLAGRQRDRAERLRFVAFAVTNERPDRLPARILDAPILEVFVEPGLVNRHQRAEPHRHRGELPKPGHQPGVRVAREPAAVGELAAEILQLFLGDPPLDERPGVDAGGGMPLKIDLIAGEIVAAAADEVVHRHLDERRRRGEGGDVPTDALVLAIGADDHRHRVPADHALDPALDLPVAGEERLLVGRDRVDVGGGGGERNRHPEPIGLLLDGMQEVGRPLLAPAVEHVADGIEPFPRLGWV